MCDSICVPVAGKINLSLYVKSFCQRRLPLPNRSCSLTVSPKESSVSASTNLLHSTRVPSRKTTTNFFECVLLHPSSSSIPARTTTSNKRACSIAKSTLVCYAVRATFEGQFLETVTTGGPSVFEKLSRMNVSFEGGSSQNPPRRAT